MRRVGITVGFMTAGIMMIAAAAAPSAAASGGAGDPVKGKAVYVTEKCSLCHRIGDAGGKTGPDLSKVGAKRDAAWLAKYLPAPTPIDPKNPPKTKMPSAKAKGPALEDLIAYLLTLR